MHRCNAAILNSLSRLAAAWPFQLCIFTVQLLDQFRQLQRCPQGFVVVCIPQFLCNLFHCTGITAILRQEEIRPGAQYAVLVQHGIAIQAVLKFKPLLLDSIQHTVLQALFCRSLLHLGAVFIHIHVFVCPTEQFAHGTSIIICRKCIPHCIAQRHFGVLAGVFFHVGADIL